MATINRFEDLQIWQLARLLYRETGKVADRVRRKNDFRFAEQMKAAAGSIMDNIAEGFERNSRLEFLNSLGISKGESGELKSQFYRALDDGYLSEHEFKQLYESVDKVSKKIAQFMKYLNSSDIKGLKFKDRKSK